MPDEPHPPKSHVVNTLGVIGVVVLAVNAAFFFLSQSYFAGKPLNAADMNHVRLAFAITSLVIGAGAFAGSARPRLVGHGLAAAAAAAALVAGVEALSHSMPPVLGLTLILVGSLLLLLTSMSWEKRSRVAWSFLASLVIVFALVTFFGAPKVRNLLHIGLWYAMMIPGLLTVCAVTLSLIRFEYRDQQGLALPDRAATPKGVAQVDQIASQKSQNASR